MPYIPPGIATVLLSGRYIRPDGTPLRGTVTFNAPTLTLAAADTITVGSAKVELDEDGAFSVTLIATDNASMQPTDWTYQVRESFMHAEGRAYAIVLPQATPVVDLADIAPADPSNGDYVLVTGPAGAPGTKIYSGAGAPANTLGINGDFYVDTTAGAVKLYGPKVSGNWPSNGVTLGSGNLVTSVNTKTGAVTLTAADVGAVPTTGGTVNGTVTATGGLKVAATDVNVNGLVIDTPANVAARLAVIRSGGVDKFSLGTDGALMLYGGTTVQPGTGNGLTVYGSTDTSTYFRVTPEGHPYSNSVRPTFYNMGVGDTTTPFGGGKFVLGFKNVQTAPTGTPGTGGIVYVEGGALKFRGGNGTVTTIAPA